MDTKTTGDDAQLTHPVWPEQRKWITRAHGAAVSKRRRLMLHRVRMILLAGFVAPSGASIIRYSCSRGGTVDPL